MGYQDVWRDGACVVAGERTCADRYAAIAGALAAVPRPFGVLDFGAAQGYFATRLAEQFGARVTAVDPDPRLRPAASDLVTVDPWRLDAWGLRALPRHDVVLALSVLHHMADWRAALDEIQACRWGAVVEVPHPAERWMRRAAARGELMELHTAVSKRAVRQLGLFARVGRDGSRHMRPMYLLPPRLVTLTGAVFSGSGTCSRKLRPETHARGLDRLLGYQPYPGSLNLRCAGPVDLGPPVVWAGHGRPYWFWPAWVGGLACHAMVPAGRGHGSECVELVASVRLRDHLRVGDGDRVTVEVCRGDQC